MFKLVIADDEGTKTVVPLVRDEISIGRKEGNTIRLTERNISRTHAQLRRANGGFVLRDLGSYNGVLVNGKRVDGDAEIHAGDQIKLGDYVMAVEAEGAAAEAPPPSSASAAPGTAAVALPTAAAAAQPSVASGTSGRLVMLAGPAPGAEYRLPASGTTRVGRGVEADITIEHRSVSREHAELRMRDGEVHVSDLGSANGVRVNGERASNRALQRGDVIEMGQVALRYVSPDESYAFDPADALPYQSRGRGAGLNWLLLGACTVGLVVVGLVVFTGGDEPTPIATPLEPVPRVTAVAAAMPEQATAPVAEPTPAPVVDPFDAALAACRDAVKGERFAEAVAHATTALRARADDPDANVCMQAATTGYTDEQIFARGKAAFLSGDAAGAVAEFAQLSAGSPQAMRQEVLAARRMLATERATEDRLASAAKARPAAPTRASAPATSAPRAIAPVRAAAAVPEPLPAGQSPFQVASACLARGDNQCVIKALTGRARTPQELGLLIETHRSLGNTDKATAGMEQYVKQFPTGPKAATYRRLLGM